MNSTKENFNALMQQVVAGDETAAQRLFTEYGPHVRDLISKRLSRRYRSKFDSHDVAQDVWASFFAQPREKRAFDNPDELIAFLTKMAQHKLIDAVRQATQNKKHDIKREQSMDDSHRFDKHRLPGPERTPSQIMMSGEAWTEFLRKQPLVYQRIFILLREGKKQEQIAEELAIHRKTIQRVIRTVLSRAAQ